ncbi:MAG: peptide ABC transporter substrate-binding protein, partial [Planctomycetia bacterium]
GLAYVFHLRPDSWWMRGPDRWTVDGEPQRVTAGDFVYAWRRHLLPETGSDYSFLLHLVQGAQEFEEAVAKNWKETLAGLKARNSPIGGSKLADLPEPERSAVTAFRDAEWKKLVKIEAIDDLTLKVTLKSPAPYFLQLTSFYPLAPTPRRVIEQYADDWILPENIVANGPFTLDAWRFNAYIRLAKNKYYWENAAFVERRLKELGKPTLTADETRERDLLAALGPFVEKGMNVLDALALDDENTALNMYLNGDVDKLRSLPTEVVGDLLNYKREHELDHVHHSNQNAVYFFCLNMRVPAMGPTPNGRKLRRALALASDRRGVIDTVTRASQNPAYGLVPGGVAGYSSAPLFGSGDYTADVAEARKLIAELKADGVKIPRLRVLYNTLEGHAKVSAFLQNEWKKQLGVDVDLANQEWGVYLDSRRQGNYDVARSGWIGDYLDPNTFLEMFLTDNQNNDSKYSNPWYDRIVGRYCPQIETALATAELRKKLTADVRGQPDYEILVGSFRREDGRTLDAALDDALKAFVAADDQTKRDKAFAVRLMLFEIAERMLMNDMPALTLYFYTSTQAWPPELLGLYMNNGDHHPWKYLRWKGGVRPTG